MKKFSFLSSVLLLIVVVTFLFAGCQKESAATDNGVSSTSESATVRGVAGSGPFAGSINGSYAAALQANFEKKYDDDRQSLRIAFSAKDLAAFIANLQAKNKSDIIYVNFGVYGKGAPAPNSKDNGRMTVFFTGNNTGRNSGNVQVDADGTEDMLNHGDIFPN